MADTGTVSLGKGVDYNNPKLNVNKRFELFYNDLLHEFSDYNGVNFIGVINYFLDELSVNVESEDFKNYNQCKISVDDDIEKTYLWEVYNHAIIIQYTIDQNDKLKAEAKLVYYLFVSWIKNIIDIERNLEIIKLDLNKDYEKHQLSMISISTKSKNEIDEIAKKTHEENETIKQNINSVYSQLISILGIFTAISFVIFGGLTSIKAILTTRFIEISLEKILYMSIILSMAIINISYLLINVIMIISKIDESKRKEIRLIIIYVDIIIAVFGIIALWIIIK